MLWHPAHSATPPEWNACGAPLASSIHAATARTAKATLDVFIPILRNQSWRILRSQNSTGMRLKQFEIQTLQFDSQTVSLISSRS
jgi:hypothetical protein